MAVAGMSIQAFRHSHNTTSTHMTWCLVRHYPLFVLLRRVYDDVTTLPTVLVPDARCQMTATPFRFFMD